MEQHWSLEYKRSKYKNQIEAERINFFFLKNGSMVYPYEKFGSYVDAMIDSIKHGEDIDDMISLVFPEKIDHPIVKEKILKMLNNV